MIRIERPQSVFTVATWNVEKGGNKTYTDNDSLPSSPPNYDQVITGIKSLRKLGAEVITLIDTHGWHKQVSLEDLTQKTGFTFARTIPLQDERFLNSKTPDTNITVLSNLAIESAEPVKIHNRYEIRLGVFVNGKTVDIHSVYLDDSREKLRLEQLAVLLADTKLRANPAVILGDLNCTSKNSDTKRSKFFQLFFDKVPHSFFRIWYKYKKRFKFSPELLATEFKKHKAEFKKLREEEKLKISDEQYKAIVELYDLEQSSVLEQQYNVSLNNIFYKLARKINNRMFALTEKYKNHGPLQLLQNQGFDLALDKKHKDTMPTKKMFPFPFINVDHILVSRGLSIKKTSVPQDKVFFISDHYPRMAEIEVK